MIKLDKDLSRAGARYLDSLTVLNYLTIIAVPAGLILAGVAVMNGVKVFLR